MNDNRKEKGGLETKERKSYSNFNESSGRVCERHSCVLHCVLTAFDLMFIFECVVLFDSQ